MNDITPKLLARTQNVELGYKSALVRHLAPYIDVSHLAQLEDILKQDVGLSSRPNLGPVSMKLFRLSKLAGKKLELLGMELQQQMSTDEAFLWVSFDKPMLNFAPRPNLLLDGLPEPDQSPLTATSATKINRKVLVEHSQPNTHKELHIGHLRNTVLGDSIAKILAFDHAKVIVSDYPGDEGAHVAKSLWYISDFLNNAWPTSNYGEWLANVYAEANAKFAEAEGTDQEPHYRNRISEILAQIEKRAGPHYKDWQKTRAWSLAEFDKIYNWLGVEFDCHYSESVVSQGSLLRVDEYLRQGVFVESEGAIGCDLNDKDLGFLLLKKRDGRGLYATKDIELAIRRFEEVGYDEAVYVVDVRQSLHFAQVFATVERMGFEFANQCRHLAYDVVQTKEGKLSSRTGGAASASSLIKMIETKELKDIRARTPEEEDGVLRERAHSVAVAALRYGMLRIDPGKKIMFDLDDWTSFEGNTGPYLLYAIARIKAMLRKFDGDVTKSNVKVQALKEFNEIKLLSIMSEFESTVRMASAKLKPNIVCNYAYELAKTFSQYYNSTPILQAESSELAKARLLLCEYTRWHIEACLALLGIPTIERL